MIKLPKSKKERLAGREQGQNSKHEVNLFLCSVCGSDHCDLVLYAQALSRRSGLAMRCRTCNASTRLFDDALDFI